VGTKQIIVELIQIGIDTFSWRAEIRAPAADIWKPSDTAGQTDRAVSEAQLLGGGRSWLVFYFIFYLRQRRATLPYCIF